VLCASIFHYGEYTIPEVRSALLAAGVPMRPLVAGRTSGI
jgi:imidazole glycerol-phosphate synthase subunit HisF